MSKQNRNKKSPMFVSNMVTEYDYVDYTGSGAQVAPNSFGNPNNLGVPGSSPQKPQQVSSPQKAEQTNWFDQMLSGTQSSNPSSSNKINNSQSAVEQKGQKNQNFQLSQDQRTTVTFSNFQQRGQNQIAQSPKQNINKQNEFNFGKKQNQFQSFTFQNDYQPQNSSNLSMGYEFSINQNTLTNNNQQRQAQPQYNFKTKNQVSYQSTQTSSSAKPFAFGNNNNSSPFDYNGQFSKPQFQQQQQQQYQPQPKPQPQQPLQKPQGPQKPKQQKPRQQQKNKFQFSGNNNSYGNSSYASSSTGYSGYSGASSSSSSSSGSGFTNQDLVNSLPEPARSNILAMIKRNKGNA